MLKSFPSLLHLRIEQPLWLNDFHILSLSQVSRLRTLVIGDMSIMASPNALLCALWDLKELRTLELDFGDATPIDYDYSHICTMVALSRMEHLTIRNAPR